MMLMGNTFFLYLSGIYNKRRGRVCPPRRNFPSEIAAVLSVKTGDRLSKPYRQWWKFTLQQKSASCFSAGCSQNRLWIFSGKWDKFGTFCPKIACFSQFYIVATTQNKSIGFIVGILILCALQGFVMLWHHLLANQTSLKLRFYFPSFVVNLLSFNDFAVILSAPSERFFND